MFFLLLINWVISIVFLSLSHPLSLGGILLIQTIIVCMISGLMYTNFWFSYILFLIMIGGMLIMFIYMTSIASNEKFKMFNFKWMAISIILPLLYFVDKFYMNFIYMNNFFMKMLNFSNSLSKFFNYPNLYTMIMIMIYLLMTLIATVKIVGKYSGTLRQK